MAAHLWQNTTTMVRLIWVRVNETDRLQNWLGG